VGRTVVWLDAKTLQENRLRPPGPAETNPSMEIEFQKPLADTDDAQFRLKTCQR
jgi:hypothetical protein